MRRQGGNYGGDSGVGGAYGGVAAVQIQQNSSKSEYYQGRHQEQPPVGEKEERHQQQNQWRWERDASLSKLPQTPMSPTAPFAEGQGHEAPKSYYQSQRPDPRMSSERQEGRSLEKQGGGDLRSQTHEEDMDIGYENDRVLTFESLEHKFFNDIMKLSKEQTDAEDAENARHRETMNAINARYEEQLVALRAQHASHRDEFLRKESLARKQQYQQVSMEQSRSMGPGDPRSMGPSDPHGDPQSMGPSDPRGDPRNMGLSDPRSIAAPSVPRRYSSGPALSTEQHRAYSSEYDDSYRERGRFPGNARDHGYESKVPYPRGRAYNTGSHHH